METLQILVRLAQLGGISASLVFLYLSYRLLEGEQQRPEGVRSDMLSAIRNFMFFSLAFLVLGVLTQAGQYLRERFFPQDDRTRIVLGNYTITTGTALPNKIALIEERGHDITLIRDADRSNYVVYVAIRPQQGMSFFNGEYPVLLGPYDFGTTAEFGVQLTSGQIASLGTGCIEYRVFGYYGTVLPATSNASAPFSPSTHRERIKLFDQQYACP